MASLHSNGSLVAKTASSDLYFLFFRRLFYSAKDIIFPRTSLDSSLHTQCSLPLFPLPPLHSSVSQIYSSTQNTAKTQNFAASVTGLPAHRVSCRMKRMGGGFGGKETRSVFVGVTAALAAHRLNRPVKARLSAPPLLPSPPPHARSVGPCGVWHRMHP